MASGPRIVQARKARKMSQEQLAQAVGAKKQTVSNWETQKRTAPPAMLDALAEAMSISRIWLHTGEGSMDARAPSDTALAVTTQSVALPSRTAALVELLQDNVTFDLYPEVSAGGGALVFDERSRITVTLPRAFVRQFLGFEPPPIMGVSEVTGDSMWPIFQDGDLVLYSLTPDADTTGLYVCNYDGRMVSKRIQPVGRGYRIISENRLAGYAPELVKLTANGYEHAETGDVIEFGIVGKILFPRPETARIQTEHLAGLLKQMFSEAAAGVQ